MASPLRSARERVLMALGYEVIAIALLAPVGSALAPLEAGESGLLLAALSLAVMGWSALFGLVFDRIEFGLTGRASSDRPHGLRIVHALLFESTAVVVTCPLIVAFTGWSLPQALGADVGLSLLYAGYGYVFHWLYDRLRPVPPEPAQRLPRECSAYFVSMPQMWAVSQTFRNVKN